MNDCFFRLWSVLEQLTGAQDSQSGATVKRRAAALWQGSDIATLSLEYLRERRNDLIHRGRDPQDAEQCVYLAKQFAEALLEFHLVLGPRVGSSDAVWEVLDLHKYLAREGRFAEVFAHARRYYTPRRRRRP